MGRRILKGSADPDHAPFREDFFIGRVELANVPNLKSRFTRYEAINGGAKCRKWGSLGQLGGIRGHRQCHHSIERIQLPIRL